MVNKSCLCRNASYIAFVGAFGVFLLRCQCFLATPPHPRGCPVVVLQHASYVLFDEDGRQTGPKHVV
jgi:hypothetical protein